MSEKKVLTMVFDDQKSLDKFMSFMSCYGEQVYWDWMDGAEGEGSVRFDYKRADNVILCPLKVKP